MIVIIRRINYFTSSCPNFGDCYLYCFTFLEITLDLGNSVEKIDGNFLISYRICHISEAVTGIRNQVQLCPGCGGGIDLFTHAARDKKIRFTVDQQYGDFGVADGFDGTAVQQVEPPKDPCAKKNKRIGDSGRIVHFGTYLLNDCNGGRKRTVSDNAAHITWKFQIR